MGQADERGARGRRPGHEPPGRRHVARAQHPRDLRPVPAADRRAAGAADRRPDQRAGSRRGRGTEARRAGDRHGVLPADGRRQRQHQGDVLQRDARAARAARPAPAAARGSLAGPGRGRGVAADVPGVRPFQPHGDARHRACGAGDPPGREGRDVVRVIQPRRVPIRRRRPLRRPSRFRASGVRRRRSPLLPWHGACTARAACAVRGDARALSEHGAGRRPHVGAVDVRQPAEDAAGQARRLRQRVSERGSGPSCGRCRRRRPVAWPRACAGCSTRGRRRCSR